MKNPAQALILSMVVAAVLFGTALTLEGLLDQAWPDILPMPSWLLARDFVFFLAGTMTAICLASRATRLRPLTVAIAAGLFIAAVGSGLGPLIAVIFCAISAAALGELFSRVTAVKLDGAPVLGRIVIGSGIYGSLISLTAHLPINVPWVFTAVMIVPILASREWLGKTLSDIYRRAMTRQRASRGQVWLEAGVTTIALVHFTFAFFPELSFDPLAMHLFVPAQLAQRHEWGFNPELYVWTLMPMLGDWVFSIGYMLGGETAARLVNVGFIFMAASFCCKLAGWAGSDDNGKLWGALLFLSTPLTFMESSALQIESVWATYMLAGLWWLLRGLSEETPQRSHIVPSALALGFAAAAKAVTLTYLPALLLPLLYRWRVLLQPATRKHIAFGVALFVVFACIPYATSYIISGNPVFPFFNATFQSPYFDAVNFQNTAYTHGVAYNTPYRIVFHSYQYMEGTAGSPGFQWVTLLAAIFVTFLAARNRKALALALIGLLSLAIVFHFQSYLRYIFPSCVILSALIGVALSDSRRLGRVAAYSLVAAALLTLGLNLVFFGAAVWTYRTVPILSIFAPDHTQATIDARRPIRNAVAAVNLMNDGDTPVAFLSDPYAAGLKADALYDAWYNQRFNKALASADTVAAFKTLMRRYGANYVILSDDWRTEDRREVVREATRPVARFGNVELRRLAAKSSFDTELVRNPSLRDLRYWSTNGTTPPLEDGSVLVSVASPIFQVVDAEPGESYLNAVRFRCHDAKTSARVQVNWIDSRGKLISASIQTQTCTNAWQTKSQIVVAPATASKAVVYGSSGSDIPIAISSVSLKK